MKNLVQTGDVITLNAPYALATGGLGFLVGSLFAVSLSGAASGAAVEGAVNGVFDLAKATGQAWTQGARIYWDDAAKNCTTTVATNKLIGVAVPVTGSTGLGLAAGDTVGRVKLTAAFTL
jgi:predicted RecA/RadA family phage recombinase